MDTKALIAEALERTRLTILVFGPAVEPTSPDPLVASLQRKRLEIRQYLVDEGHKVLFGEDVIDPTLPPHLSDPLFQESVVMQHADLIFVLVGSPGANAEAMHIAHKIELVRKTSFYCFDDHKDGLLGKHLSGLASLGAHFALMTLASVNACALRGDVVERARALHTAKAFML